VAGVRCGPDAGIGIGIGIGIGLPHCTLFVRSARAAARAMRTQRVQCCGVRSSEHGAEALALLCFGARLATGRT
jgi:hypothetical protein